MGVKILFLVENGFEDSELIYPYYRLQEEKYQVEIVGPRGCENYCGKYGVPIRSDSSPDNININDYDALVIPGGLAPDKMRCDEGLVKLVKDMYDKGKIVAAICHGPQMLIEANVIKGKKATCWRSVKTDLINAGAKYIDEPVVTDDQIVTSRCPADLPEFSKEIIKLLKDL